MTIPRSSTESLATTHCPAAARHQELGTPRDRAPMAVGVAVHHLVHAAASRNDGVLADVAIDQCAVGLVSDGRSFDGGPAEYLSTGDVDTARDLALGFLDRDVIPERGEVDWMEAELNVAMDRAWERVDRAVCKCGHLEGGHGWPTLKLRVSHGDDPGPGRGPCAACDCQAFDPVAIWQQTVDLVVFYQDEIDDEEVSVVHLKDHKGGNCSKAWFTSLQGKGCAVTGVVLRPGVDIVRREVGSYMRWGGTYIEDLDLRQQEDLDTLQDYRRAIEVASAAAKARQGRTPDELASPGAGCSAGFGGCPWLLVCGPFREYWGHVAAAHGIGLEANDPEAWASVYALSKAMHQESGKLLRRALKDTNSVATVDGKSRVGWREKKGQKVTANAAMLLSREWVEAMLKLKEGSPAAQFEQPVIEALLMNALPKKGGSGLVKNLVKRLKDVIGWEAAKELEAQCLEDDPGRMLACWKEERAEPTGEKLNELLRGSLK